MVIKLTYRSRVFFFIGAWKGLSFGDGWQGKAKGRLIDIFSGNLERRKRVLDFIFGDDAQIDLDDFVRM